MKNKTQLGIIGSGVFAREVLKLSLDIKSQKDIWFDDISCFCYLGINSSIKQGNSICEKVMIGLNAGVVKNIETPGTYIGAPANLLYR